MGSADADGLTERELQLPVAGGRRRHQRRHEQYTYALVAANEGDVIKVRVTFTDDDGNEETLISEPTAAVAAAKWALTLQSADGGRDGPDAYIQREPG